MSAEQRIINWTETARLQLVEAVIKVEKEMIINASKKVSGGSTVQKTGGKTEKWNAITRLLPVELRAKTNSRNRQLHNTPRCYSTFHTLVKAYRDKVVGKGNRWNLTEPVCRVLKRREDLLNGRSSVPLQRRLIPGSSKRVNARNQSSGRVVQRLSEKVANSSEGKSFSAAREIVETELERPVEALNFDNSARKEQETDLAQGKSKGNARIIQWTETGCLQVIEAVRQVEEETRNKCNIPIQSSTGRPMTKWERVEVFLPHTLRGRTWNVQRNRYNKYKCERVFDSVLKAYRDTMKRRDRKGRKHSMLTQPVCDLLKRLLSARSSVPAENSLKSGSTYRVSASTYSANHQEHLSASGHDSLNSYPDEDFSTDWRSTGTATEQGATFMSDHTNNSESTEKVPHSDKKMDPNHIAHDKSTERNIADSSLGCPSRPLILAHGSHNQTKPPSSTGGPTSTSGDESNDCKQMATPSDRHAVPFQTQARHLMRLRKGSRISSFVRKSSTTLMTHGTYDETLHAIFDGPLRRLDLEFSHLSSWLQSQTVPMGTKLMNEMTSSAIRSSKRRKLNDPGPSADIIDDSFSRYMDFRIGAAFEKVRTRIAEELKNTCAELTRDLHQGRLAYQFSQSKSCCE